MFTTTARFAILAMVLLSPTLARAQGPIVSLKPLDPPRWDVAAHIGWFGADKSELGPDWNEWYDTASFDLSGGYYWTPHLKLEVDVARTTTDSVFVEQPPSPDSPFFRYRDHDFSATTVGAGLSWQFFENAWFHPFLGGGVAAISEHEEAGELQPAVVFRDASSSIVLPQPAPIDQTTTVLRPFASTGFKLYLAERVFFRTDVRFMFSERGNEAARWRAGFGFDF